MDSAVVIIVYNGQLKISMIGSPLTEKRKRACPTSRNLASKQSLLITNRYVHFDII
jgi:hypothetical protein